MAAALLDIPKLLDRVKEISKTYKPPKIVDPKEINEQVFDPIFISLKENIRSLIRINQISDAKYWKSAGIRVETQAAFEECMDHVKKTTKLLGEGFYGKVYKVPASPCFKNVPKGVKHIGVKVELMKPGGDNNQTPERLKIVTKIGKRAGDLKIGPKMYDAFVTIGENGNVQIIKLFEIIDGKPWAEVQWKTPKMQQAALDKLDGLIHKMNKAGIIHHDLHTNNVMVGTNGSVYIIDFDLATLIANEEEGRIGMFETPVRWSWQETGILSDHSIKYIFDKLVEEGSIVLPAPKVGGSRFTRRRRRYSTD